MKFENVLSAVWTFLMGAFIAPILISQFGCAPLRTPPKTVSAAPQVSPARPAKPPEEKLPGLIVTEIEGKREPERLYSFSLRDADIREVLMALSKQTSFNIVVDLDVQGRVTVDLKNVSMVEALDTLTELLDLNYRIRQNVVRVGKPAPATRIFSLQYVNLKRTSSSSATAQIGTGTSATTGTTGGGGGGGSTTVSTSTDTDLWKDVEAGVTKLLSPTGKMVVDKQSSNILVTDLPKFLDRIGSFLESVEGSVQRQVLIEARILEVTLTGQYQFGIDWGAITQAALLKGASTLSAGKILAQKFAPASGGFQIGVTRTDFNALLSVLSEQGELKVISSPKLATLNNQTAVIRAGTDEVFFETRVSETPSLTGTQTSRTVSPRTVTIGVVLGITPQIGADGTVVLHVHPAVTEKRGETKSVIGDTFPIIDVREADMVVRAKEGEVVVIGGLMQEKKSTNDSKVPILGDLPGIGRLFSSTTQEARKTELVVLLSATVMVGKKVDEITSRELERLNKTKGRSPW
jgi:MSHA biogenesis protein MshL